MNGGSNAWVVENLSSALSRWNRTLQEIWAYLQMSPVSFKGGSLWQTVMKIYGALSAVGYGLLVLFFLVGLIRKYSSFSELKRPTELLKTVLRFLLAKAVLDYGPELMLKSLDLAQGIIARMLGAAGVASLGGFVLPQGMIRLIGECSFLESIPLWIVTILGSLLIWVLSLLLLLEVYGRFFKIYLHVALSPLALSTLAGEGVHRSGLAFIRSFLSVVLEGIVMALSCVLYVKWSTSVPGLTNTQSAVTQVWMYIGEVAFQMFLLVGSIKTADAVTKSMFGLHG